MSKQITSNEEGTQAVLTPHAMLVAWGLYAQEIGLVKRISQVELSQKTRTHRPQTKILEFLVAILAGVPHLQDVSRSAHPLDQDQMVAEAWGQPEWADYSGISRTLQRLSDGEAQAIVQELEAISQPFIEQETELALHRTGYLVYDADLTGRPVSSSSTTYPEASFGYMGDTVALGYQAAMVSLHSPTYGRLWLSSQLHGGDTVSATQTHSLVKAAEMRTGLRPRRRTELVATRLASAENAFASAEARYWESNDKQKYAQDKVGDAAHDLADWRRQGQALEKEYADSGRQPTGHCKLTRVRRKVDTYEQRLPRLEQAWAKAQQRLQKHERALENAEAELNRLRIHHAQLQAENQVNLHPIKAVFRVDSGFASRENIAWLIEMGYDIYTKARSSQVQETLLLSLPPEHVGQQVGRNATMTAWADVTGDDYFVYPVNVALARYQTGKTVRHSVLIHYGDDHVTKDLKGWFHMYNGRQTIEAGIKEGKNVFQMHHLKVRSGPALFLQEQFACFAANFVRFAAHWLIQQQVESPGLELTSVKHMVQVCAHTSAWVLRQGNLWLLTFAEQSLYAGRSLRFGFGSIQLPLPLAFGVHFSHF